MAKAKDGYKPLFGFRQLPLDADRFALDEPGWVQIPTRITVGMTQRMGKLDETDATGFMRLIVKGWEIKADGIALRYNDEGFDSLPIDIVTYITEETNIPLERAAATTSQSG
jgi:hypothetical protein